MTRLPEFEKFATDCFATGAADITIAISDLRPLFTCIVGAMEKKGIEHDTIIRRSLRSVCPDCGTGLSGEVLLRTAAEVAVAAPVSIGGSQNLKAGVCDNARCSARMIRLIWKRAAVADAPPRSSKCFVATAAFGGELHHEVAILRDFRDRTLIRSLPGRLFVRFYELVGPILAERIERSPCARAKIRALLRMVTRFVEPARRRSP